MRRRPRVRTGSRARDVNTHLQDYVLRRAILQQRYENGAVQEVDARLRQTATAIASLCHNAGLFPIEALDRAEAARRGQTAGFGLMEPQKYQHLQTVLGQIAVQVGHFVRGSIEQMRHEVESFGKVELHQMPRDIQTILDRHTRPGHRLQEAADCTWVTIRGNHVCITGGHGHPGADPTGEARIAAAAHEAGLPPGITFPADDQALRTLFARGAFRLTATEDRGPYMQPGERYRVTVEPKMTEGILPLPVPESDAKLGIGKNQFYDSRIATAGADPDSGYARAFLKPDSGYTTDLPLTREPGMLFRGMSFEEYQAAVKTGSIKSSGSYNLGQDQEGQTYFAVDPQTAESYASSFQPYSMTATFGYPAYIVKIKDPGPDRTVRLPHIGENEVGVTGDIPLSSVLQVVEVRPYSVKAGYYELNQSRYRDEPNLYASGSGLGLSSRVAFKDITASALREAIDPITGQDLPDDPYGDIPIDDFGDMSPIPLIRPAAFDAAPTGLRAISPIFRTVPNAQITELLGTPLGGAFFQTSFADLGAALISTIRNTLLGGLASGQSVYTVTRNLQRSLGGAKYKAERIVRSEFGRVANQAALATYSANADVIQGVQWVSTLDADTCLQCGELDGRTWESLVAAPIPVADTHPNCRCRLVPVVKDAESLGLPPGSRASFTGQVAETLTYDDWFDQQDRAFQRSVLGPTRYRLYQSGRADLKDFATASGVRRVRDVLRDLGEMIQEATENEGECLWRTINGHPVCIQPGHRHVTPPPAKTGQQMTFPFFAGFTPLAPIDQERQAFLENERIAGVQAISDLWEKMKEDETEIDLPGDTWGTIDDETKSEIQNQWESDHLDEFLSQAEQAWRENDLPDAVDREMRDDEDWQREMVRQALEGVGEFTAADAQAAADGLDRAALRDIVFDEDLQPLLDNHPEVTETQQRDIRAALRGSIDIERDSRIENAEVPDSVKDQAYEEASDAFHNLDGATLDDLAQNYGSSGRSEKAEDPDRWVIDPATHDDSNYAMTGAIGSALVTKRAEDLWRERYPTTDPPNFEVTASRFWDAWKRDSYNQGALRMHAALVTELGANTRQREIEAANTYGIPNPYDATITQEQVYARALWETTQFLLTKANTKDLTVYRAVIMDRDEVAGTKKVPVPAEDGVVTWTKLPELPLQQNAAQSTSFTPDVTNHWNGVGVKPLNGERVVVRAQVPPTAVWSLPVYGKNIHEEREAVILGTPWLKWDAWLGRAPEPLRVALEAKRLALFWEATAPLPKRPKTSSGLITQDGKPPVKGAPIIDFGDPKQTGGKHWLWHGVYEDGTPITTQEAAESECLWRTIEGRHICIKPGHGRHAKDVPPPTGYEPEGFHGTTADALRTILKEGLKAGQAGKVFAEFSKTGQTYLSTDVADAIAWAAEAATRNNPAADAGKIDLGLLEIDIPDSEKAKLKVDENFVPIAYTAMGKAMTLEKADAAGIVQRQFSGDIKPEWIKRAWITKPNPLTKSAPFFTPSPLAANGKDYWQALREAKETSGRRVYLVLVDPQIPTLLEADECLWRTINGNPVCIRPGHGRHAQGHPPMPPVGYHGTSADVVKSIMHDGILASKAGTVWPDYAKSGQTYLTTDVADAVKWAHEASQSYNEAQDMAIVEIAIPPSERDKLSVDANYATGVDKPLASGTAPRLSHEEGLARGISQRQFAGDIKPEWITGGWVLKAEHPSIGVDPDKPWKTPMPPSPLAPDGDQYWVRIMTEAAAGAPIRLYLAILIAPTVKTEAADECIWRTIPGRGPICITAGHTHPPVVTVTPGRQPGSSVLIVHSGQTKLSAKIDSDVADEIHVNFLYNESMPVGASAAISTAKATQPRPRDLRAVVKAFVQTVRERFPQVTTMTADVINLRLKDLMVKMGATRRGALIAMPLTALQQEALLSEGIAAFLEADDCTWRTINGNHVCITPGHAHATQALSGKLPQAARFLTDQGWQHVSASPSAHGRHQSIVYRDPQSADTITVFANGDWAHEFRDGRASVQGHRFGGLKLHVFAQALLGPGIVHGPSTQLEADECVWRTLPGRGPVCLGTFYHKSHDKGAPIRDSFTGLSAEDWGGSRAAIIARAKAMFGETDDFAQAGYVFPDGSMLNLHREKFEDVGTGRMTFGADWQDHREVYKLLPPDVLKDPEIRNKTGPIMADFMRRTGAVRVNFMGIDSESLPTEKQVRAAVRAAREDHRKLVLDADKGQSTVMDRPTVDGVMAWFRSAYGVREAVTQEAEDACHWITYHGRHICIADGHGEHERTGQVKINGVVQNWGGLANPAERATYARDLAHKYGLPEDRVEIREGDGPTFRVGNQEFGEGGHYDPKTATVVLWADNNGQRDLDLMMSHEATHHQWHVFQAEVTREVDELSAFVQSQGPDQIDALRAQVFVDPVGSDVLKADVKGRWPALYAMKKFEDVLYAERPDYGEKPGPGVKMIRPVVDYAKSVSSYAAAYWEAPGMQTDRAINETLAEITRRGHMFPTPTLQLPPGNGRLAWEELWNAVQATSLRVANRVAPHA